MPTGTAGDQGQEYHTNQVHYLSKKFTFADDGQTALVAGTLPPNAAVIGGEIVVVTAFNGNTTNTVDVGVAADGEDFASNLALGTKGVIAFDEMATALYAFSSSARDVLLNVVSTASASAGEAYAVIRYVVHRA